MADLATEIPREPARQAERPAPALRPGRPEAAAAIWDWRTSPAPKTRSARLGGVVRGAIGAAIGAVLFLLGHHAVAIVAWSVSGLLAALALLSPGGAYAAVSRVMDAAGRFVGLVLTWALLGPLYLGFFTVFGLLFRRGRRDPLARRIEPDAPTYWKTRDPSAQVRSMEKPY